MADLKDIRQTEAERLGGLRNELLVNKVIKGLERRNMEGYFCQNTEESIEKVLSLLNEGDVVSWGGSMTIRDIGLTKRIKADGRFNVLDRDMGKTEEEVNEIQRQALLSDSFITSVNAISDDGLLVNIDSKGNRVAAMSYGPKQVIVVAGINKIAHSEQAAIERARNVAAPTNIHRFPNNVTPCSKTGICANCISSGCICRSILITRMSMVPKRIKVIIVNEKLGF